MRGGGTSSGGRGGKFPNGSEARGLQVAAAVARQRLLLRGQRRGGGGAVQGPGLAAAQPRRLGDSETRRLGAFRRSWLSPGFGAIWSRSPKKLVQTLGVHGFPLVSGGRFANCGGL